jgi:hypothetical protein
MPVKKERTSDRPNPRIPRDPRRAITMDDVMWGQVQELAARQHTNASQIVRDAVELFLRDHNLFVGRTESDMLARRLRKENE